MKDRAEHIEALSQSTVVDIFIWVAFDDLYREYSQRISDIGCEALNEEEFQEMMIDLEFEHGTTMSGRRVWHGIGLLTDWDFFVPTTNVDTYGELLGRTLAREPMVIVHDDEGADGTEVAHWFDTFLEANTERSEGVGIRDADLYTAVKEHCQMRNIASPTWPEYHAMLKERGAKKRPVNKMMMLWGLQWKQDAPCRPIARGMIRLVRSSQ